MDEGSNRWGVLILLLLNLTLSGVYRHRARRRSGTIPRSREGKVLVLLRLGVVLPVLAVLVAYLLAPAWSGWPRLPIPERLRQGGLILGLVCAAANYWILKTLGENISETILTKADHQLIRHGPYRWVRHPLYSNGLLLCLSLILATANSLLLGLLVIFVALLTGVIIPREEAELVARFGDQYRRFQEHTGRLFPRLFR